MDNLTALPLNANHPVHLAKYSHITKKRLEARMAELLRTAHLQKSPPQPQVDAGIVPFYPATTVTNHTDLST